MYHGDKKKKMAMGGMYVGAQPRQNMMIGGMAAKGLFGAGKNLVGQLFDDKKGVNFGEVAQAGMQGAVSGIPVVGGMAANALQQTPFMQRFQQMKGGMNGVKLMKGGAVYAQKGVNTNGVNDDLIDLLNEKDLERAKELGIFKRGRTPSNKVMPMKRNMGKGGYNY